MVQAALESGPDAKPAVHVEDMIDDGEWDEWYDAFGSRATTRIDHVTVPGNHEYAFDRLSGN